MNLPSSHFHFDQNRLYQRTQEPDTGSTILRGPSMYKNHIVYPGDRVTVQSGDRQFTYKPTGKNDSISRTPIFEQKIPTERMWADHNPNDAMVSIDAEYRRQYGTLLSAGLSVLATRPYGDQSPNNPTNGSFYTIRPRSTEDGSVPDSLVLSFCIDDPNLVQPQSGTDEWSEEAMKVWESLPKRLRFNATTAIGYQYFDTQRYDCFDPEKMQTVVIPIAPELLYDRKGYTINIRHRLQKVIDDINVLSVGITVQKP